MVIVLIVILLYCGRAVEMPYHVSQVRTVRVLGIAATMLPIAIINVFLLLGSHFFI